MRMLALVAVLGALGACATTSEPAGEWPPERDVEGECKGEVAMTFVGMRATGELGREMLAATGARTLRWVPPRTAVTMDFRPDRLTVSYDDDYIVTQASCT